MSVMQKPNGPCSNDAKPNGVNGCKPMFIDFNSGKAVPMTDDEDGDQPLSQQEIEFTTTPTTTTIATSAAGDDEAADTNKDTIVDGGSDVELDTDDLKADIGSEKTVDTADIDADANVANNEKSGSDGANDSQAEITNAEEPEAGGAADNSSNPVNGADGSEAEIAEPESNGTADNSSNPVDGVDGVDGADSSEVEEPVSNGATDNNSNPNTAAGTTDDANNAQTNSDQPNDVSGEGADPDNAMKTDEEFNTGVGGEESSNSSSVIDKDANSVAGTDEVIDSDGLGNDEFGGAVETSTGTSLGKDIDEGESNEASQNTSATTATSDGSSAEEATQSFYSCSSSSGSNGGAKSKPDGAIKVLLKFNYDLTTSNAFNSKTLNALEDSITKDLAGTYNLIACSDKRRLYPKRRYLRKLEADDNVLALDSKPSDVNIGNVYECMDNDPNSNCTPISGFMTAYLGADSDEEATKAAILQRIQQGMESGDYLTNEIIKTSFIGMSRPARDNARDNSVAAIGLGEQGNRDSQPSIVIGISVVLVALVVLVGLGVLHKKERKKRRQTHASEMSRADTARGMEIAVRNTQVDNSPDMEADKDEKSHTSSTLSSNQSCDEEDLKYGITEDYGDLAATFTYPNLAPRHPESCLAVIDSLDNMEDARSFETGTPKTSPRNAPIVTESLLPGMISPASSAEVLEPEAFLSAASVDSPVSSTNVSELATPEFEAPNVDSNISSPDSVVDNGDEDLLNVDLNATVY